MAYVNTKKKLAKYAHSEFTLSELRLNLYDEDEDTSVRVHSNVPNSILYNWLILIFLFADYFVFCSFS